MNAGGIASGWRGSEQRALTDVGSAVVPPGRLVAGPMLRTITLAPLSRTCRQIRHGHRAVSEVGWLASGATIHAAILSAALAG